jgi:hypothetical protein
MDQVWGYCERCKRDGTFPLADDEWENPHYVVCVNCSWETAHVYCPECEQAGWLASNDINAHPMFWVCTFCGTQRDLPEDFYDHEHRLVLVAPGPGIEIKKILELIAFIITVIFCLFMISWAFNEFVLSGKW